MEKELAKRSHFCQKVIKRQKQQLTQYEKRLGSGDLGKITSPTGKGGVRGSQDSAKKSAAKAAAIGVTSDELKGSEELINFLENKLEVHERNLQKRQYEYDALQADYALLEERFYMTQ